MKLDPNAPAFPVECDYSNGVPRGRQTDLRSGYETGLTVRQHIAAMAMQGAMSADTEATWPTEKLVQYAVKVADALIAELNRETT